MAHLPGYIETKSCAWCGNEFQVTNAQHVTGSGIKRPGARYCSRGCSNQARFESPSQVRKMKVAQCAYLAGLIDGEGSVCVIGRRKTGRVMGTLERRLWRVVVTNTDLKMIQWCAKVTGAGNITTRQRSHEGHRDIYRWTCHASTARVILEQIVPYMITKRLKALEAIEDLRCLEARSTPRKSGKDERQSVLKLVPSA